MLVQAICCMLPHLSKLRTDALLVLACVLAALQTTDAVAQNIFTLVATPSSHRVDQGANVPITISTAVVSGSAETITLSISGLPTGVTPSFDPTQVLAGGTSTLTLTADDLAEPVVGAVVTVHGVSASDTESTTFALTVDDVIFRESFDGVPPGCTSRPLTWESPAITFAGQSNPLVGADANAGDVLTLTSNPIDVNSCLNDTHSITPYTYEWSLVAKPPGSNASLSGATSAQPTFVPDIPSGQYTIQVVVTDALGNTTPPAFLTLVTSSCGANPVSVQITVTPGNLETDPVTLFASPDTNDANPAQCPARFAPTYTYSWSVASSPPSSTWAFSSATSQATTFLPSRGGTYDLQVSVNDSNNATGTAQTTYLYKVATATTLASSNNPSLFGQSVTFTATVAVVAPGIGTPTGTVTFNDSQGVISSACSAQSLSGGVATCVTSALTASGSPDSVTATYNGDSNSLPSNTSNTVSQVIKSGTTTALTSSSNALVFGESVTFTATITATAPGVGNPTGTVAFTDGASTIGGCVSQTVSGGIATCATSALTIAGSPHSISAVYSGDVGFAASSSNTVMPTVSKAGTTASISSDNNPTVFGQTVTLTANIAVTAPGSGTPTGTVIFKDGTSTISGCSSRTVSGGMATCATNALPVGSHSVTATYSGDTNFQSSASSALNQSVNRASTITTVSSDNNPSTFGQSVTFTATIDVIAPGGGTPTGTVAFQDGGVTLASCGNSALMSGTATCTTSTLSIGPHTIRANYSGDANFLSSASNTLNQNVN